MAFASLLCYFQKPFQTNFRIRPGQFELRLLSHLVTQTNINNDVRTYRNIDAKPLCIFTLRQLAHLSLRRRAETGSWFVRNVCKIFCDFLPV